MSIEAIIRFLSTLLGEDPVPDISRGLQNWFWRTTSAAELLYALTDKLSNTHDPILKAFAAATLVPVAYRRRTER